MDLNEFMGSGAPVWELKSDKHRCKTELDLEIEFFFWYFIDFIVVLRSILGAKKEVGEVIFESLF